jgi:hypothetical protein
MLIQCLKKAKDCCDLLPSQQMEATEAARSLITVNGDGRATTVDVIRL